MASFEEQKAALPTETRLILEGWSPQTQRRWIANPGLEYVLQLAIRRWQQQAPAPNNSLIPKPEPEPEPYDIIGGLFD